MLNPKTESVQFAGAYGTTLISIGLPALVFAVGLVLNSHYTFQGNYLDIAKIKSQIPSSFEGWTELLFDFRVWKFYLTWFWGLVVLDQLVPGRHSKGIVLRDGSQLDYKINGLNLVVLLTAIALARLFSVPNYFIPELEFVYENVFKLSIVATLFSLIMANFVYVYSFIPLRQKNQKGTNERILAEPGNTGNPIYDWFIGRELNPRIGSWDIKLFCELKPGLLLWMVINLACLHHQYHSIGRVYDSLLLVNFLQSFYVLDGVLNEEGLLNMLDITTDGFGFMLAFGDLSLVPFTYTIQSRWLAQNYVHLGYAATISIVILSFVGYYIFRAANKQKTDFRAGKLPHLKSISTPTGSHLLIDGWWSISQHINYFGDWLNGLAWCLPTGFSTPITYYYAFYFAALLLHRQTRDDEKCSKKYGKSWELYKQKVPYKIIPYVY